MARLPLEINGNDFSALVNKYGFSIGYVLKNGPNGGQLQDGSEAVDRLGVMATIVWQLNDLPSAQLQPLLNVCLQPGAPLLSVKFFDPQKNANRRAIFVAEVGEQRFLLQTAAGVRWFSGGMLTLREVKKL